METDLRQSPVRFKAVPAETERRGDWEVVRRYRDEGAGPHIIDLSHIPRWDIQDRDLTAIRPAGLEIPKAPGVCHLEGGVLINRMNRTQAAVWYLDSKESAAPDGPAVTEVTDATCFLAVLGKAARSILEKVSGLDLADPDRHPPFLVQGPVSHVPGQVVYLGAAGEVDGVLMAVSRGYGASMVTALMEAGAEWGMRPAGEATFTDWLARCETAPWPNGRKTP